MKVDADYSVGQVPSFYRGNPLIEALPPILGRAELERLLLVRPSLDIKEVRALDYNLRIHALGEIETLYIPRNEVPHIESAISQMIRSGYMRRNPIISSTTQDIYTARERMRMQGGAHATLPPCLIVTALSGTGKTRTIRIILSLLPQVIRHRKYGGKRFAHTQITYLSLDAPISGSPQGLLLRAFSAIDKALGLKGVNSYANQFGRAKISVDQKIEVFAQLASTFHLGILHIDDLQRLTDKDAKQGQQVLALLIQLANVVKVPLIFSGTHKMSRIFAGSVEAARRVSSGETIDLPLPDGPEDAHFTLLVKALEMLQVMDMPVAFDATWRAELFRLSRGIPAVLVSIISGAQRIALRAGAAGVTLDHVRSAYDQNCGLLKPALEALRMGDQKSFLVYEDLLPSRPQLEVEHTRLYNAGRRSSAMAA